MAWDPSQYLRFADHRTRPGLELIARIPAIEAGYAVDLGAGPGHLTAILAEHSPQAEIVGVDSSVAMVERAEQEHPALSWQLADIASWEPDRPVDILYSNATLHWLDDHAALFARLRSFVAPGGVLAVQMPDNWHAPTHTIPAEILDDGSWPAGAQAALLRDRLSKPGDYWSWVQPATVDLWRTTYYQVLAGEDPVWEWVTGSVLRPVLEALKGVDRVRFERECKARYLDAYPPDASGTTVLPFSRLFLVATVD